MLISFLISHVNFAHTVDITISSRPSDDLQTDFFLFIYPVLFKSSVAVYSHFIYFDDYDSSRKKIYASLITPILNTFTRVFATCLNLANDLTFNLYAYKHEIRIYLFDVTQSYT